MKYSFALVEITVKIKGTSQIIFIIILSLMLRATKMQTQHRFKITMYFHLLLNVPASKKKKKKTQIENLCEDKERKINILIVSTLVKPIIGDILFENLIMFQCSFSCKVVARNGFNIDIYTIFIFFLQSFLIFNLLNRRQLRLFVQKII